MRPPNIENSTKEEREEYVRDTFRCKGNCDICGNCAILHGKTAEVVYKDYIAGERDFIEISMANR